MSVMWRVLQETEPLVTELQECLGFRHPLAGAPEPWDEALEEVMGQGANRPPSTC